MNFFILDAINPASCLSFSSAISFISSPSSLSVQRVKTFSFHLPFDAEITLFAIFNIFCVER